MEVDEWDGGNHPIVYDGDHHGIWVYRNFEGPLLQFYQIPKCKMVHLVEMLNSTQKEFVN